MPRFAAVALCLLFAASSARAEADDWIGWPADGDARVTSGSRAAVARPARRGAIVETRIPDDSPYARGLRLDAEGRHADALREFIAAVAADGEALSELASSSRDCRAARRAKLIWQREESEKLLEQESFVAVMPQSVLAHYHLASAYHAKFLAIRAFLGRAPRSLWDRARAEYARTLELDRRFHVVRAQLAALYAQGGKAREARLELAALGSRVDDPALAAEVAAALAALGDLDGAFAALGRAELSPEKRRHLARANDFDPLRADPRFARLAGDAWAGCE